MFDPENPLKPYEAAAKELEDEEKSDDVDLDSAADFENRNGEPKELKFE